MQEMKPWPKSYCPGQNGMSKGAWNRYAAKGSANYDIFSLV